MTINEDMHEVCHMRDKCIKFDKCPMVLVQDILSGKRKILILWYLSYKARSLEEDGLILRNVYPVVPPKVEYSLTELGQKIIPILELMHGYGTDYLTAQSSVS
ncbi:MAG: putative transcriptional regulator [Anaerocolumna sp.]|nr:putative transcriptional regulator [Anaerocolumna sp.]